MHDKFPARKWTSRGKQITISLNDSAQHQALYRALYRDAEKARIPISRQIRYLLLRIYKIEGE